MLEWWVWVQLQLPLLPISVAWSRDYHGSGDYRGVEKEILLRVWLQCDEYRTMLDVFFCCYGGAGLGVPKPHLLWG